MKCPVCSQLLPDDAIFCHKCSSQIKCKECKKPLLAGAIICNYCGISISNKNVHVQAYPNRIEFKEDHSSRTLTTEFSDGTAEHVVNAVSQLLVSNKYTAIIPSNALALELQAAEMTNTVVPNEVNSEIEKKKDVSSESNLLREIFQIRGEELVLHETELKASTKSNYFERLTLLFLLYKQLEGEETTSRNDLNLFLEKYNLYDGNYRKWLSKNKKLINSHNNQLSLSRGGIDKAKTYLSDVFDESKIGKWVPGISSKNGSKKSSSTSPTSSNKRKGKTYSNLGNLNLNPKGKESLNDFVSQFTSLSGLKYNAIFVYYLEKIVQEKSITADHIYTCYKWIKVAPPSNLYQSMMDTSARYAWIDTSDINNLKITLGGENMVESKFQVNKK